MGEEDLIERLDEAAVVVTLKKVEAGAVVMKEHFESSAEVLARMKIDVDTFCSAEQRPQELRGAMNTLFRAVLLDGITMLELIGQSELYKKLRSVQREFLNVMREGKAVIAVTSLVSLHRHLTPVVQRFRAFNNDPI